MCDYTYIFLAIPSESFFPPLPLWDLSVFFSLNVFCHLTKFTAFSHLSHSPFRPVFLLSSLLSLAPLSKSLWYSFFQLESTNNVWSSHHQGSCHRVAMATSSPRSSSHCGENGEAETERTHSHTNKHAHPLTHAEAHSSCPSPHWQPMLICFNSQWEC